MKIIRGCVAVLMLWSAAQYALAEEVDIHDAWVRGTVAAQKASGAYMRITAAADLRLIGAHSPVAEVTEVHEMVVDNDVMKMRRIESLEIPAGTTIEFQPQGNHIMLMGLKQALKEGENIPFTLSFERADGTTLEKQIDAPVRPLNATPHGERNMDHGGMKKRMN